VGDAIIRPNGDIIRTDPKDTIIATKNGGFGNTVIFNIENINGISGRDLADALEEELTNRVSLS